MPSSRGKAPVCNGEPCIDVGFASLTFYSLPCVPAAFAGRGLLLYSAGLGNPARCLPSVGKIAAGLPVGMLAFVLLPR